MCACSGPPISAFQGHIRGSSTVLRDHISKEMNELNLERCRCIPKLIPGADWRVLQEIIEQHPERTLYKVRCIETAAIHWWCSSWWALLAQHAGTPLESTSTAASAGRKSGIRPDRPMPRMPQDGVCPALMSWAYKWDVSLAGLLKLCSRDRADNHIAYKPRECCVRPNE